jgi:hypothetical protein
MQAMTVSELYFVKTKAEKIKEKVKKKKTAEKLNLLPS